MSGIGPKLLVVDDDQDIRDCLRECLRGEGYEVYAAEHGKAALNLLQSGVRPDVILLDLMMPVMNGFDFLEACRQKPEYRDTPVIVVSAATRKRQDVRDVFRIFDKPVSLEPLLEAIELAVAA